MITITRADLSAKPERPAQPAKPDMPEQPAKPHGPALPAKPFFYGGQAVLEGVMMRGPEGYAVAVRRPSGEIVTRYTAKPRPAERYPILGWPVVRGLTSLVESLIIGIESLLYSANEAMGEEEEFTGTEGTIAVLIGVIAAVGLFMLLPTVVAGPLRRWGASSVWVNLAEGLLRLVILVGYVWAVGRMSDIRRVYRYHGAEHKVINCYEAGAAYAEPASADRFSSTHRRCGTSFLLFVVVVSIVLFSLLGWPNLLVRIVTRLALLPVVAGVAYELLRLGAVTDFFLVRWLVAPGLWLQRLTTGEPDLTMLEVAGRALATLEPPAREPRQ